MFHFTKKLSVNLHYNFRLLFTILLRILWYQIRNTDIQFSKFVRGSSLFRKCIRHSCVSLKVSWRNLMQNKLLHTATKLNETERLFQKCVQLYLNYILSTYFVTRCQLFAEKNVSRCSPEGISMSQCPPECHASEFPV